VASQLEAPKLNTDRAGVASQPGADADGAGVASQTAIKQGWHRNWERRSQTPTKQGWHRNRERRSQPTEQGWHRNCKAVVRRRRSRGGIATGSAKLNTDRGGMALRNWELRPSRVVFLGWDHESSASVV
jgi:hypothetical protein